MFVPIMWLLLLMSAVMQSDTQATGSARLNSTCDFEPASPGCGWRVLSPVEGTTGVTPAEEANFTDLGPSHDYNPGTEQGHYMFFSSRDVQQSLRILSYPSHNFICAVSFAYYVVGPIDVELLRVNFDLQLVVMGDVTNTSANDTTWQRSEVTFNTSDSDYGELIFQVAVLDFGEAMSDPNSPSLFLGLDDIVLTFCVSCDYNMLKEHGAILVEAPERIDIRLRRVTVYSINASIPVCPNETVVFSIVSVEPEHVSQIFSMDPDSGVLTVHANGAGLDANGTTGIINVSVSIINSNYSHSSQLHSQTAVIPFTQPPTITYTAPSSHTITLGEMFTYNIIISTFLSRPEQLIFGQPITQPPELATDVNITTSENRAAATVAGVISLDRVLPIIVQRNIIPFVSIPIFDNYGGLVVIETLLHIPMESPIFNQSDYTFSLLEESGSGTMVGQISLIDPNGHHIAVPSVVDQIAAGYFLILPSAVSTLSPYTVFDIVTQLRVDYEQHNSFSFEVSVADTVDLTLTSAATVTVNILSVNEFVPLFVEDRVEVTINDVAVRGSEVAVFTADDRDTGQDGVIVYSITAGNNDGFFEIAHESFGEVVVRTSPLLPHTYTLIITARDQGSTPRSANATLIVQVIATTMINCSLPQFGPPHIISSELRQFVEPRGVSLSLDCVYMANPTARGYKWNTPFGVVTQNDSRYSISESSLSLSNLAASDGGLYTCNVTNQCGHDTVAYVLDIVDVPGVPFDLHVTFETDDTIIGLAWQPPNYHMTSQFVLAPLDNYLVEARQVGKIPFTTLMKVDGAVTNTTIAPLYPGTTYDVRVVAANMAGGTPSESINITTNASVPRLEYFQATGLDNYSILIEWAVEYDGGFPITSLEIHVVQHAIRDKRSPPMTYVIDDAYSGRYVTRVNEQGHTYILSATARNYLGSSESQITSAFIGTTDSTSCDFEVTGNCLWNMEVGVITQAQMAPDHLPVVDSSGSSLGFYVYAQVNPSTAEAIVLSYPVAGYVCGFSVSYWLSGNDSRLYLRSSSGMTVWSTNGMGHDNIETRPSDSWVYVNTTQDRYVTSDLDDQLQFVLVSGGAVAIDDITLKFCLPCDFDTLRNEDMFSVSYSEYNELHLRTMYTLTLQATVGMCPNVALNSSFIRVIPSDLSTSFSLSAGRNHTINLSVSPITTDQAEPGTIGLIELSVSVVHSDYRANGEAIEKTVVLEFVLLETSENCSTLRKCDFERSCDWQLGVGTRIVGEDNSPLPQLSTNTGSSYLFTNSTETLTTSPVSIATAIINDDYCAVSFAYSASASVELEVTVDSLGVIWSSVLVTDFSTQEPTSSEWLQESIQIDLQAINFQDNRSLSFQMNMAEGFGEAGLDMLLSGYVTLDNITLHPCIDCDTPECVFSSCIPGHYFSLAEEMCTECPQGYYCPDWRLLPQPCPPGTFSTTVNSALIKNCLPCPNQSFTVRPGSVSCEECPEGYDCSNSSAHPVRLHNICPTCQSCPITMETTLSSTTFPLVPVLAVVGIVGGVLFFLCLLLVCLLACCYRTRKGNDKSKHRTNRSRFDGMSIGSAGSLGRSSLASSSTFTSLGGGRKRWKGGRDTQTLMSFLADEEPGIANDPYYNESSWTDTEELTNNSGEPSTQETVVSRNSDFEDVSLGDESLELANHSGWQRTKVTQNTTSQF